MRPCQSRPARGDTHINLSAAVRPTQGEDLKVRCGMAKRCSYTDPPPPTELLKTVTRTNDARTIIAWAVLAGAQPQPEGEVASCESFLSVGPYVKSEWVEIDAAPVVISTKERRERTPLLRLYQQNKQDKLTHTHTLHTLQRKCAHHLSEGISPGGEGEGGEQ